VFKSNQRPLWREIVGNPEGHALGSPGDLRYSTDTQTLWIKAFGRQSTTGWRPLGVGGGGGGSTAVEIQNEGVIITSAASILNFTGGSEVSVGGSPGEVDIDAPDDWDVVYDVDFRDAHAALGDVDLNSPGNTFTYEDIPWVTPSVAGGFPVDQVASVSWALTSAGLSVDTPNNSRLNSTNNSAPSIIASLADIAQNSRTPFDGDPTRKYRAEVYVSSIAGITNNGEGSGIAIGMQDTPWAANASMSICVIGRQNGVGDDVPWMHSNSGNPVIFYDRADLSGDGINVAILVVDAANIRGYGAFANIFAGTDWAEPGTGDRFLAGGMSQVFDTDEDVIGDAIETYNFHIAHDSETIGGSYEATIQRFRLLRA